MHEVVFTNSFLVTLNSDGTPKTVCLAMKKRGFGAGLLNGAGGKPEPGEDMLAAAKREVTEEFGVTVKKIEARGVIEFILKKENKAVTMHVFLVTGWDGEPSETEEMKPAWFRVDQIPFEKMWASDKEWLPLILAGQKFTAKFTYAHEGGAVEKSEVNKA